MTTPEERERRKYQWEKYQRLTRMFNRIEIWFWIALLGGLFILSHVF